MNESRKLDDAQLIDDLERELSELASRFRSEPQVQESVVEQYGACLEKLFQIPGWSGEPDADSQLPDKYMPDVYLQFWDQRIGSFESILRSELKRASDVRLNRSTEEFLLTLGPVVQAARLNLAHRRTSENSTTVTCETIALLAIALYSELQGNGVPHLVWRICKRLLGTERINLDDQGEIEAVERLQLRGFTSQDLADVLARYSQPDKELGENFSSQLAQDPDRIANPVH